MLYAVSFPGFVHNLKRTVSKIFANPAEPPFTDVAENDAEIFLLFPLLRRINMN